MAIALIEQRGKMADSIRPTKKQKELLTFISNFIDEHGYSPSYREIMTGLNYTSVATVALHVNNLIKRGHLLKRENSARSLEVVKSSEAGKLKSSEIKPGEEKWLVEKIEHLFAGAEQGAAIAQNELDQLYVLVGSLRVLGLEGAAQSFIPRLTELKNRIT
jgi:SOS-response transcriptional repressor LexA